jgi:hypothetical protein
MIKLVPLAVASVVLGALVVGGGAAGAAKAPKQKICHVDGKNRYRAITVSGNAVAKHEKHGDVVAGSDGSCNPTAERHTSSSLSFGPSGWGGWSCPAGDGAVGGGHTLSSVAAEGVAEPGATIGGSTYPTFPHYTFGSGETGYVVQNDNDSETGTVFVDCV